MFINQFNKIMHIFSPSILFTSFSILQKGLIMGACALCFNHRYLRLCLDYVPSLAYGLWRVSNQSTILHALDFHNAWPPIHNLFNNKVSWCKVNQIYNNFNVLQSMSKQEPHGTSKQSSWQKYSLKSFPWPQYYSASPISRLQSFPRGRWPQPGIAITSL